MQRLWNALSPLGFPGSRPLRRLRTTGALVAVAALLAWPLAGVPSAQADPGELTATYTGELVHLHLLGSFAQYTIKRADKGGNFDILEFNETGCTQQCTFDDFAVTFGAEYEYAIEVLHRNGQLETFGPVPLSISKRAGLDLQSTAFPNPMERLSTIRFTIPATIAQTGTVRSAITLHDPSGRVVRELWSDEVSVGRYEVEWNGRDAQGRELPGGLYFFRIQADAFAESGRIILLR